MQKLHKNINNIFLLLQNIQTSVTIKETKKLKIVSKFPINVQYVQEHDVYEWTGGLDGLTNTAAVTA